MNQTHTATLNLQGGLTTEDMLRNVLLMFASHCQQKAAQKTAHLLLGLITATSVFSHQF